MRRPLACLLLAVALATAAPVFGSRNGAYRHGRYAAGSTRLGRDRAVYSSRTHANGKSQVRVGTRSRSNPNVIVMRRAQ